MKRRLFLQAALGGCAVVSAQPRRRYRAALIGHTGAGNYGHEWDTAWNGLDFVEVVAVADVDEAGRRKAVERSHAQRGTVCAIARGPGKALRAPIEVMPAGSCFRLH